VLKIFVSSGLGFISSSQDQYLSELSCAYFKKQIIIGFVV